MKDAGTVKLNIVRPGTTTRFRTGNPNLLAQGLRPATDRAIDKILHERDPNFHKRLKGAVCPLCPEPIKENTDG